jgi:hypothetical protein
LKGFELQTKQMLSFYSAVSSSMWTESRKYHTETSFVSSVAGGVGSVLSTDALLYLPSVPQNYDWVYSTYSVSWGCFATVCASKASFVLKGFELHTKQTLSFYSLVSSSRWPG